MNHHPAAHRGHHRVPSDVATEAWSVDDACDPLLDTQSEPPGFHGWVAERIMDRVGVAGGPMSKLEAKLSGMEYGGASGRMGTGTGAKKSSSYPPPSSSTSHQPSPATTASKNGGSATPSQVTTTCSSTSLGSSSNSKNRHNGTSHKSNWGVDKTEIHSQSGSIASYHPGQPLTLVQVARDPPTGKSSGKSSRKTSVKSSRKSSRKSSSASSSSQSSSPSSSSNEREDGGGGSGYDPPPKQSHQSRKSSDPPSNCSSGPSNRSVHGGGSGSGSAKGRRHRRRQNQRVTRTGEGESQLAVWKEEKDDDDDDEGGNEGGRSALSASSSRSGSTGGGSSSSTSSSSSSRDSFISGAASLNTAVRQALAITAGEGGTSSDEDDDDEEGEDNDDDDDEEEEELGSREIVVRPPLPRHNDAELVKADGNRFLAAAVDNYNAMVPVDSAIYEAYDHTFVTCPESLRFRFLYTFLKKNLNKKVVIFFSTTNSVRYHAALLDMFRIPVLTMHGDQRREKFVNRFFKFSDMDECILCTTDAAGRDLDIPPSVDWVVQFEPPDDPSEYILRVARISCDSDRVGRSLLFLNPGEKQGFLKYYHSASIPVSEFELPPNLAEVQSHIENATRSGSGRFLRRARDAYGSYLIAYASHSFRDVYNVHDLNKGDVAESFGLVGGLAQRNDDCYDDDGFTIETGMGTTPEVGHGRIEPRSRKGVTRGKKDQKKTWMKGEKSWPHSQIKLHPNFKGSAVDAGYH
ncbi:hypothetical protein ACHAXA_004138 [Cyclostephanos tholiformis]|uniref:Helicase C-terminal domain-containing protein n=1 Tax=Cyclostephanos tholiformis TaxID=382380 RepID=A0ABD3SH06_9STRA